MVLKSGCWVDLCDLQLYREKGEIQVLFYVAIFLFLLWGKKRSWMFNRS